MEDNEILVAVRMALLTIVDAIERKLGITPRTSELRRMIKQEVRQ